MRTRRSGDPPDTTASMSATSSADAVAVIANTNSAGGLSDRNVYVIKKTHGIKEANGYPKPKFTRKKLM
jgi:hypothetical protein